ncbi:type 1 fimbrial protein [Citrobacter sp. ku-bf4]|uniref:fimbrial protein n=1 Tax=Citrobacter TaxID=544 RepID=UPI0019800E32|nr:MULTISPECIES: fimbrial protein [Citrobacter]MBN6044530.1 type 1 fimbrial protein [Citrobacter sp. ku-bf4]MBS0825907.1 type 1 fimbrial protein [Citrobacter amalonaticus]
MNTFNKSLSAVCFAFISGISGQSVAADGTVHFTGTILDQACEVDGGSQDLKVELGTISAKSLENQGESAATPFTIALHNCPESVTKAQVRFDGTPDSVNKDLLQLSGYGNDGVAKDVGIMITDMNNHPIPVYKNSGDFALNGPDNTLQFLAKYVGTTKAIPTGGTADGIAVFSIDYR